MSYGRTDSGGSYGGAAVMAEEEEDLTALVLNLLKLEKNMTCKLQKQVTGAMVLPEYKDLLFLLEMEKQEIM